MDVIIPPVGESITEVVIGQWLKSNGSTIEADEVICELESDKANFELRSEAAGLLNHKAQTGDTLAIGSTVATIEPYSQPSISPKKVNSTTTEAPTTTQGPTTTEAATTAEAPATLSESIEVIIPNVGESITEVVLSKWIKKEGTTVKLDESIAELESDKANFELTAPTSGLLEDCAKEGDSLAIGAVACRIAPGIKAMGQDSVSVPSSVPTKEEGHYAAAHPSPAAAKLLAEKGLSPNDIKGSGIHGRITKGDVLAPRAEAGPPVSTSPSIKPAHQSEQALRGERKERLSSLRKTIARRLVQVKNETAMLTTFNEIDMQPVMGLRKKYKEAFKEKYEVGLGFMSFFTKAVCMSLQEFPAVNAKIEEENSICYHDYCDISIAVSTPKGLVVPVVRSAEQMSFEQIEKEILRLAVRAKEGKISITEMNGGTFTITNGGIFGSLLSTPILNAPQSAILGMHNIVERPVVVAGSITARPMMYVALSYDHRIIDGKESVSFLVRIKELLEDPARLMLGI